MAERGIHERGFSHGRYMIANKHSDPVCKRLSLLAKPIPGLSISRFLLSYPPFYDKTVKYFFHDIRLMFELPLQQPPLDDAVERVLGLRVIGKIGQDLTGYL